MPEIGFKSNGSVAPGYLAEPVSGQGPGVVTIFGPVLGHFGTKDEFVSVDNARALEVELRPAGVDTTFEFYEGAGHAFFNDTNRLGTYDAAAADASWSRTVEFLRARTGT